MRYLTIILFLTLSATCLAQDQETQLAENSACDFLNSIKEMDYNKAKNYGTENTAKMLEFMSSFVSMMPDSVKDEAKKITFAITEVEVIGDKAKIMFIGSDRPDRPEEIKLIKSNGHWLVDMEVPQIESPIQEEAVIDSE